MFSNLYINARYMSIANSLTISQKHSYHKTIVLRYSKSNLKKSDSIQLKSNILVILLRYT